MTDHPITPPRELMQQWREQAPRHCGSDAEREERLIERAAQWGTNQELEATLAEVFFLGGQALAARVRAARRPKPPTRAEIALEQYDRCVSILKEKGYSPAGCIRDALVRLKQLEDSNG